MLNRPTSAFVVAAGLAALTGALIHPAAGRSQDSRILFHEVVVSRGEASLTLELVGGQELSVGLVDGNVEVDGSSIGSYEAGGALETAWRSFLGDAISLDPGALEEALLAWQAPAGLTGAASEAAAQLTARLAQALGSSADPPPPSVVQSNPGGLTGLRSLLSADRLNALASVVDQLDLDDITIHIGEAVVVPAGQEIEGSLLIVDGSLDLQGTVDGDVFLIGGTADIGSSGEVDGSVRTVNAQVRGAVSRISEGVRVMDVSSSATRVDTVVREIVREARADRDRNRPFRSFGRGVAGLFQTLVTFVIWFGIGLAVLYFFPRNLEVISRTARTSPGRSFLVGVAAFVLSLPLWIIGMVLLAVTIIGIPLLLFWIPLAPVVVVAAATMGVLGVAMNLGRWFTGRDLAALDGFDTSRPAVQLGGGLAILLAAYALANVFEMGGAWFDVFSGLFIFLGVAIWFLAASVGLGAVILSRAGRAADHAGAAASGDVL